LTRTAAQWEIRGMSPGLLLLFLWSFGLGATEPPKAPTPAGGPPAAAAPGVLKALPTSAGPFELAKSAFTIVHECQQRGWRFLPRPDERVVNRRGAAYVLSVAIVLPPEGDEAASYRLSFLDGRLVGVRMRLRSPDRARLERATAQYGPPTWEAADRAEWVAKDRSVALALWRDGSRQELVALGHARATGFFTDEEISAEIARRKAQASPAMAPPGPGK
jgi:hypothetical protein